MSYILDALRRADAERERGEVPSLHSQQYSGSTGDDETRARPRWLVAGAIALVLAVGAALLWKFAGGPAATPSASGVVVLPPPATSPPAVVLPTSPAVSTASVPSPAAPASATAVAEPAPPANLGARRAARTTSASAPTSVAARKLPARQGSSSASNPSGNPAPAADRGALPDAVRRDLPALAFGGSSYSNDAASRMVIFNGRVFHEGDTIAPQLTLEQIKQKAAVLRYKGYTYEIAF